MSEIRSDSAQRPPVAAMVESIVGCKWSLRILSLIVDGETRPSALLRGCAGLSAKVLNERLAKMTRFEILERRSKGERPPFEVRYELTPFGLGFLGVIDEIRRLQATVDGLADPSVRPSAADEG